MLFALATSALVLAVASWTSVTRYESRYAFRADLPPGEPLADRVVLVVLDGIRLDASRRMPQLQSLAERGSSGSMQAALPSLSNPNRAVLVTGAWPEVTGVTNNALHRPPPIDSVFSLAKAAGIPVAAAGSTIWGRAFGEHLERHLLFQRKGPDIGAEAPELIRWQEARCADEIAFLRDYRSGFLAAGVTSADAAGHDYGGESETYHEVALAVDRCLGSVVTSLDDGRTAFVIASDHGHIQRRGAGGHGGAEPEVVEVPLVLAGRGVRQNGGWSARSVDVAPTICALLGLPLPATNQGDPLWPALDLSPAHEAQLRERAAEQQALTVSRIPDRADLQELGKRERLMPAMVAFLMTGALIVVVFVRRRVRWLSVAVAASVYFATYYLLFFATGLGYSLSDVGREEYLLSFLGANIFEAGGAFLISSLVAMGAARNWVHRWDSPFATDLALLISGLLGLRVAWIYWNSGLIMTAAMLDLDLSFEACLHLLEITGIALVVALLLVIRCLRKNPSRPALPDH